MTPDQQILDRIPHRHPFLLVERIVHQEDKTIDTSFHVSENLDVFKGHYPDHPIMPGVLLCEAIFQSGGLLMSFLLEKQDAIKKNVPVLTRIENAKFKRPVYPGDTVDIRVSVTESLASVSFMKGVLKVGGKVAVQVNFACALTSPL